MKFAISLLLSLAIATPVNPNEFKDSKVIPATPNNSEREATGMEPDIDLSENERINPFDLPFGSDDISGVPPSDNGSLSENSSSWPSHPEQKVSARVCPSDLAPGQFEAIEEGLAILQRRIEQVHTRSVEEDLAADKRIDRINTVLYDLEYQLSVQNISEYQRLNRMKHDMFQQLHDNAQSRMNSLNATIRASYRNLRLEIRQLDKGSCIKDFCLFLSTYHALLWLFALIPE